MEQIIDFFTGLFNTSDWPARWVCGRWSDFHGWLYIISDLAIFSAYFAIPILIVSYVFARRKQHQVDFLPVFWLFGAFILLCGLTHLIDALSFWWPAYRINGFTRLLTAIVSWGTVFAILRIMPQALTLKSPAELKRVINEKTKKLENTNKELEQFAYSISHDLRLPLTSLLLSSDMLYSDYNDKLDDEGKHLVQSVKRSTEKMAKLIDDVLEISRLGLLELKMEVLDMKRIFSEELDEIMMSNSEKKVEAEVKSLPLAFADETLVRRIVSNLLSNAIKYSRPNTIIRIEVGYLPDKVNNVYYVKDNGKGFSEKDKEKIFIIFNRLETDEQVQGSGIGLAVVKKLVEMMGGEIWAKGELGKGATFYFSIPKSAELTNNSKRRFKLFG